MRLFYAWRPVLVGLAFAGALLAPVLASAASVPPNKALVYVIQGETQNFANLLVFVNGRYVESVRANTYFAFVADPGTHEISTAAKGRAAFSLNVNPGATYYISQRVNRDGMPEFALIAEAQAQPLLRRYHAQRREPAGGVAAGGSAATDNTAPDRTAKSSTATDSPAPPPPAPVARAAAAERPADGGLYVGVSVGASVAKDATACPDVAAFFATTFSCTIDDNDMAFGLFGGYRIDKNLAVEAGYLDLGEYTLTGRDATTNVSEKITADGFVATVVGTLPVTRGLALLGRAGIFHWSVKDSVTVGGLSGSASKSGNSVYVGAGVSLELTKSLAVRGTFEKFKNVGDLDTTGRSDIDLFAASLVYSFR